MDWSRSDTDIVLQSPFLARVLLSLPMIADASLPTMATDGTCIRYSPAFAASLPAHERDGVRVHECLHVLLGHHVRRGARDPQRWNVAADYETNLLVRDAGYALPAGALIDERYRGWPAERIYDALPAGMTTPPSCGEVTDAPGEQADALDAWRALAASTRWGALPGDMDRALRELIQPRPSLAAQLAPWLIAHLPGDDETWAPSSRRCQYLPSADITAGGHAVVCIDTSGSMSDAQIAEALACVAGVLAHLPDARLDVIAGDTEVRREWLDVQDVASVASTPGGGGTDFRPLLARAASLQPDVIAYLTDGYGTFGEAPTVPVVWVLPEGAPVPPFGATVRS